MERVKTTPETYEDCVRLAKAFNGKVIAESIANAYGITSPQDAKTFQKIEQMTGLGNLCRMWHRFSFGSLGKSDLKNKIVEAAKEYLLKGDTQARRAQVICSLPEEIPYRDFVLADYLRASVSREEFLFCMIHSPKNSDTKKGAIIAYARSATTEKERFFAFGVSKIGF